MNNYIHQNEGASESSSFSGIYNYTSGSEGYEKRTDWLITNYLPSASVGTINGPSGGFKSFLTLDMAYHISTGKMWCDNRVKQGSVLYVAGEGASGVKKRIKALELVHGEDACNLHVISVPVHVAEYKNQTRILNTIRHIETVTNTKVKLLILDTLARNYSGDENTAKDMNQFVLGCDIVKMNAGVSIICVHHTGKDVSKGARGSSSLKAACDFEFFVKRDANSNSYQLVNSKQKDADEAPTIEHTLDEISLDIYDEDNNVITSLARTGGHRLIQTHTNSGDNVVTQAIKEQFGGTVQRAQLSNYLYSMLEDKPTGAECTKLSRQLKALEVNGLIRVEKSSNSREDMISLI